MSTGESLPPEEEQTVREFAASLGIADHGPEADAAVSQAWGNGYGTGLADAYRRGRSDEREADEIRRRGMAAHPSALGPVRPPRSALVRTFALEGLAVGLAWALGSLLGELAARSVGPAL